MTGSGARSDKPSSQNADKTARDAEHEDRCASTYVGTRCELAKGHAGQHVAHGVWMVRKWDDDDKR